jgi:tRNA G46 methylase TrmB
MDVNTKARKQRRRLTDKPSHTVWAEKLDKGGYIIFAGIEGTEAKTIAGTASSKETLEYNMRKAKLKFGLKL